MDFSQLLIFLALLSNGVLSFRPFSIPKRTMYARRLRNTRLEEPNNPRFRRGNLHNKNFLKEEIRPRRAPQFSFDPSPSDNNFHSSPSIHLLSRFSQSKLLRPSSPQTFPLRKTGNLPLEPTPASINVEGHHPELQNYEENLHEDFRPYGVEPNKVLKPNTPLILHENEGIYTDDAKVYSKPMPDHIIYSGDNDKFKKYPSGGEPPKKHFQKFSGKPESNSYKHSSPTHHYKDTGKLPYHQDDENPSNLHDFKEHSHHSVKKPSNSYKPKDHITKHEYHREPKPWESQEVPENWHSHSKEQEYDHKHNGVESDEHEKQRETIFYPKSEEAPYEHDHKEVGKTSNVGKRTVESKDGGHLDHNGIQFVSDAKSFLQHRPKGKRMAFQIHGQQGPHSYKFGYDTGKGHNRQFRFEERDGYGEVRGRYGFYDKHGKLQIVNYSAHPKHGFQTYH